jgi:3-dehydroquinate synthase
MPIDEFSIRSKLRTYRVHFVEDMVFLKNISPPTVYIVDKNVWDCHSDRCLRELKGLNVLLLEVNEEQKNLQTVQNLYREIVKFNAKKNLNIVSIGGGITQDITGFLCSTLYRGVKWIFIPTTLLAQADSCIGSKTSLNFDSFKNLIGTFYPPADVYIYTPFIKTQKKDDYFSGLGEVVKLHLIGGQNTTKILIKNLSLITDQNNTILSEVIYNSLMIKKEFIEDDELDSGRRNMLNYGHCIGHALESVSDYKIPHGQAVIVGMILANIIARNRKLLSEVPESILAMQLLFPILRISASDMIFNDFLLIEAMKMDKKRIDLGIPIVMLTDNFIMQKFNDLSEQEIIFAVNEFRRKLQI